MTIDPLPINDPKLNLTLERVVDVPRSKLWAGWTRPELLKQWFTPAPWSVSHCEIDLRPGGIFKTVMRSPDGQEFPNTGCYLEVIPQERLIWTDSLLPGFRPSKNPFMTAVITFQPHGEGTLYRAVALHRDEEACQRHAEMGFHSGWGKALDQLVALAGTLA